MKKLYFILSFITLSTFVISQDIEIVAENDNHNYAGETITITGVENILSQEFFVKNVGSTTTFYWSRTVVSKSSSDYIIQLCDDQICYPTTGFYWVGPEKEISSGDSLLFKPQITTKNIAGSAEVKYFVLDGNQNKIDSLTVVFTSTLSTKEEKEFTFNFFPNPAQDAITISGENLKNGGTVVFLDALGKEVKQASIDGVNNKINISSLKRGVYFVNIYNQKGIKSAVQRLVKK